jgi:hypothetical protein
MNIPLPLAHCERSLKLIRPAASISFPSSQLAELDNPRSGVACSPHPDFTQRMPAAPA